MEIRHLIRKLGLLSLAAFSLATPYGCQKEQSEEEPENNPEITVKAGAVTDKSVEAILEFQNSEKVACALIADKDEITPPDANWIFENGQTAEAAGTTLSLIFDAEPGTAYTIYAASSKGGKFSDVSSTAVTTLPPHRMLSFIDSDKTSFTYKVEVEPNVTYRHCYLEGWYFEYALAQKMETEGENFDMSVFLWNLLADFGYDATGTQEITWTAGDMDEMRNSIAYLAPGKKYYAIFSLFNETEAWHGTPEAISFEMEAGGKSSSTVTPEIELCEPAEVRIRMNCDETVRFFFYQLYTKESADLYLEENGEAGMMEHLFEYGWPAGNTYTDVWDTDPSTDYTLLIYGVDVNGDEFFTSMDITSPALEPSVAVEMKPYERELEGYHTYDTFEITVKTENISGINTDDVFWIIQPKANLEEALGYMGMDLESLKANPEYLSYIGGQPLPAEDAEQLAAEGRFTRIFPELEANTEYCYAIAVPVGNKYILGLETAFTEPEPSAGEADPEYKEFLGEWTVIGKSTQDWSTLMEYTLRFEELTPNRSFKVYGWGNNEVAQEFPFIARYDTKTKKIAIDTPQVLGKKTIEGKEYEIIFEGLFMDWDSQLYINDDHSGPAFTGKITEGYFALFGEMFELNGMNYDFKTMAYMGRIDGKYYVLPGDEYNNVNFHISRKN